MVRITIRDMLWLTVVVAMGVGWSLDHKLQIDEHDRQVRELLMKYSKAYEIRNGRLIIIED